jgi:hypothetical protein
VYLICRSKHLVMSRATNHEAISSLRGSHILLSTMLYTSHNNVPAFSVIDSEIHISYDTIYIYIYIYLFNRNWVDTRWQQYNTHLHTNRTQNRERNIHNNKKVTYRTIKKLTNWGSAGRAPSLRAIPWHLPCYRGKSTENPQLGSLSTTIGL